MQAKLAGDWFPVEERDMAVTVSVVARSVQPHPLSHPRALLCRAFP